MWKRRFLSTLPSYKIGEVFNYLTCWVHFRGPVIQANGRLTFEDDFRSGGLLCFISMNAIVHTELADSMVTLGNSAVTRCREMATLAAGYIPQCKVPLASSSGVLNFIVCEVL